MRCPECEYENLDSSAKYCTRCGSRMKPVVPSEVRTLTDLESVVKRHKDECDSWDVLYCVNESRKEMMHGNPRSFILEAMCAFDYCEDCPEVWIALFAYFHHLTEDYETEGM